MRGQILGLGDLGVVPVVAWRSGCAKDLGRPKGRWTQGPMGFGIYKVIGVIFVSRD